MATLEQLVVRIEADTERLRRELQRAERATGEATGKMDRAVRQLDTGFAGLGRSAGAAAASVGRMLAPFAAAATAALSFGKLVQVGRDAALAFQQAQQQAFRLDALIRATGNTAGLTSDQIEQLARRMGEETLASTQGVRDAAGVLLTFRSVSGDTFTRTIELAQDLAAVLGGNLQSTVLQLGKALESPVDGVSALKEAGVSFTTQQRDVIKSLVDTGRTAEAQSLILDELARQVGGAGRGEAAGLAGAADTAAERWKLFYEALGATGPVLGAQRALNSLSDAAARFLLDAVDGTTAAEDLAAASAAVADAGRNVQLAERSFFQGSAAAAQQRLANAEALLDAARERVRLEALGKRDSEASARAAAELARAQREADRAAAEALAVRTASEEKAAAARLAAEQRLAAERSRIEGLARAADDAELRRRIDAFDGYDAAVAAQVQREARARQQAVAEAASSRVEAEAQAQREIDRRRQDAHREQLRLTGELSDRLVEAGRSFLDALFDDSRTFWQDFADLARRTLTEIAAEQLFRAPASAFAQGLFGTGGATGGANAGGIAGLAGSLGRSVATSAISDAIGLPSFGSIFGFGGGGAAAAAPLAAIPGVNGGAALAAGSGLFGGGGLLGLGAVGGPLVLGGLALGGAALLGGFGQNPSVGPNASARLVLENNRFALGPTGADNGGERFLGQAESEALAAAATLNRLIDELGLVVEDVPDAVDLATAFGDSFNRGGRPVVEDVLRSGALGPLSQEQIAAALNDGSIFGAQVEAVRRALQGAGTDGRLREAQRIVDQASREAERRERDRLGQAVDAARERVEAQRDLVAALSDTGGEVGRLADTLDRDVDALLLSRQSPLSPAARLAEARRQFAQALASGDRDRAAAAGDALTREGASFFGTATSAGAALFDEVVASLRALEPVQAEAVEVDTEALRVAEEQLAVATAGLASAEAALVAFERSGEISTEQLAAAERQIELLAEEQAALDAIAAALAAESPDAAILRQQLDALERVGAGQDAVANAVRELATSLTATRAAAAGAPVTAIGAASAGGDRFAQVAAELQQFRDFNFGFGAFADGGVVRRPTLALIGEAGQDEAVIPLRGGAVPVTITGGASADGIRALVAIGVEQVDALGRMERRLAALEADSRLRGAQRAVGAAA